MPILTFLSSCLKFQCGVSRINRIYLELPYVFIAWHNKCGNEAQLVRAFLVAIEQTGGGGACVRVAYR